RASGFDNQCVIRLGEALTLSGVDLRSFRGAFCWHGHGRRHPLRVEQFKLWLDSGRTGFLAGRAERHRRGRSGAPRTHHHFAGRTGVVVFLDFWGRNNTGDHVDLWDGTNVAHGASDYFERSREIWFWPLA